MEDKSTKNSKMGQKPPFQDPWKAEMTGRIRRKKR